MLMRIFIAHVRPHVDAKEGPSDPRLKQVCPYPTSQPTVLGKGEFTVCGMVQNFQILVLFFGKNTLWALFKSYKRFVSDIFSEVRHWQ